MRSKAPIRFLVLGAALLAAPAAVRAQATVVGVQNLAFGNVIPGVPTTVPYSDAVRAGRFQVSGVFLRNIRITFTLPTQMNRIGGGPPMPLSFGNTSAAFSGVFTGQTPFNPNAPFTTWVWFGTSNVFLGGTASPTAGQPGGSYTANVIMTVILL